MNHISDLMLIRWGINNLTVIWWEEGLLITHIPNSMIYHRYPSHKSHNASDKYPTMHHFVTEMCTHVHISVTKGCIVGHGTGALWDLCNRSIVSSLPQSCRIEFPGNQMRLHCLCGPAGWIQYQLDYSHKVWQPWFQSNEWHSLVRMLRNCDVYSLFKIELPTLTIIKWRGLKLKK